MTVARVSNAAAMAGRIQRFIDLRAQYPSFVVGFDLVGQEDIGKPLDVFVEQLRNISDNGRFYFHAGETNWFNTGADLNLVDAILMNTKRIGHGYSIFKHPVLWNAVKQRGIAIEICPISNQVLHLVEDLRNHPATFLVSENIPITVSLKL